MEELINKYKLTGDFHKKVLNDLINDTFTNKNSEDKPSILFVIGQPGCGKSTYISNTNFSNYININSDSYRKFHKDSNEIINNYPTLYTKLTNHDAHLWGDELFNYGVSNNFSLLREKAPTDLSLIDVIKKIPDNYNIKVQVIVTDNMNSLIATRERYINDLNNKAFARLSNLEAHNKCYDVLPSLINELLKLNIKVEYVYYENSSYQIYEVDNKNYKELLNEIRNNSKIITNETLNERLNILKNKLDNTKDGMLIYNELIEIINK